jgi:hypothetical protein
MSKRRVNLHLSGKDINRLQMISFAHGGVSWSAVMRSALLALSVQLGMEKNEFPENLNK